MFQTLPFREAINNSLANNSINSLNESETKKTFVKGDFVSDQNVRWCPGCGDYAILSAMQRSCAAMGKPQHEHVFISGIGCSSRFPYYMNAYGFHTIHGRAPGLATGLALTQDKLNIWVITGDGDGLSIGIGHLLHMIRRNVNVKILLFNNRIYGLTKGQYSPTSELGKVTRSSPKGTVDRPFEAMALVSAAGASFTARVLDRDLPGMEELFKKAVAHQGTSFIEIYQNCNIFNDGAFAPLTDRATKQERTVFVRDHEPLVYAEAKDSSSAWVITWDGKKLARVRWLKGAGKPLPQHALIHESGADEPLQQTLYSWLTEKALADQGERTTGERGELPPPWPVPFGLFHVKEDLATYDESARAQVSVPAELTTDASQRDAWLQRFINGAWEK